MSTQTHAQLLPQSHQSERVETANSAKTTWLIVRHQNGIEVSISFERFIVAMTTGMIVGSYYVLWVLSVLLDRTNAVNNLINPFMRMDPMNRPQSTPFQSFLTTILQKEVAREYFVGMWCIWTFLSSSFLDVGLGSVPSRCCHLSILQLPVAPIIAPDPSCSPSHGGLISSSKDSSKDAPSQKYAQPNLLLRTLCASHFRRRLRTFCPFYHYHVSDSSIHPEINIFVFSFFECVLSVQ